MKDALETSGRRLLVPGTADGRIVDHLWFPHLIQPETYRVDLFLFDAKEKGTQPLDQTTITITNEGQG